MRRIIAVLALTALMVATVAAPALAQARQRGLVNVNIEDVTVQVPIGVAANLCDVKVAALLGQIRDTGGAECTATAESIASRGNGNDGDGPPQRGLVNVNIQDLTVQAPVGVAANVCDVKVAALVGQIRDTGSATCDATADTLASRGNGG